MKPKLLISSGFKFRSVPALSVLASLCLFLCVGCGGYPEDSKENQDPTLPDPDAPSRPVATPTPTLAPGERSITMQVPKSAVVNASEEVGAYQITVQISSESLGLGHTPGDVGQYTLTPLIVEIEDPR